MSREIKFRAWDTEHKRMLIPAMPLLGGGLSWGEKGGYDAGGRGYILEQFTGILDKNGITEIYEGDIIGLDGIKKGDIHENPDLLEDKTNLVVEGLGTKVWRTTDKKAMERGCLYSE